MCTVNQHFPGICLKVFRGYQLHFLLYQFPFLFVDRDAQDKRSCPVCHCIVPFRFQRVWGTSQQAFCRQAAGGQIRKCGYTSYACYPSFRILPRQRRGNANNARYALCLSCCFIYSCRLRLFLMVLKTRRKGVIL